METPDITLIWKSCKSYWKIESVKVSPIFESCYNFVHLKLSKDNKLYLFNSSQENLDLLKTSKDCNLPYWYTFSWWKLPKEWDLIYFTSEYWYNQIIAFWKQIYDSNKDLPDCWQYIINPVDWSYNSPINYEIMMNNMCKSAWKISTIKRSMDDKWWSNWLNIEIVSLDNKIFNVWATELVLDYNWQSKILGLKTNYPTYNLDWKWQSIAYFPKRWDDFYAILDNNNLQILQLWEANYNSYSSLNECKYDKNNLNLFNKCKVSWTVENIKRSFTDTCWLNLGIKVKNEEDTYIVWWREYFSWKGISVCLWAWEWWFPIDSTDWKITTQIKVWDNFYAVLDQKDNTILRYGQDEYNGDSSIPVCSSVTKEQIQTFTWGITSNQLKQIMDTVEKQIVKDFPDLNKKSDEINSSWTNTNSSWITTAVREKNIEVTKPIINTAKKIYIPKQIISTNKNNINTSSDAIIDSWTTNNSTQISTWANEKVNTWTIIQNENVNNSETLSIQETRKNDTWRINIYSISWIIILMLIIFYFIYKKSKIK